jgi:hypothetical protein
MSRSHTGPTDNPSESTTEADTRGVAYQLDFLTAILIASVSISLFFLFGVGLLEDISADDQGDSLGVARSADMLADDYLVSEPQATELDRGCTENFFTKTPSTSCNQDPGWNSDSYLEDALPMQYGNMNATLETTGGGIQTINGNDMTVGDPVPTNTGDINQWSKYVLVDANDDGNPTIHRLLVYYWG